MSDATTSRIENTLCCFSQAVRSLLFRALFTENGARSSWNEQIKWPRGWGSVEGAPGMRVSSVAYLDCSSALTLCGCFGTIG